MTAAPAIGVAVLIMSGISGLAQSQPASSRSESLVISVQRQNVTAADGGSIGVDWIRASVAAVLAVGARRTDVGTNRWTVLKVGGTRDLNSRFSIQGNLEIGPGTADGEGFRSEKLELGFNAAVSENWSVSASDTYFDVTPVAGHLVTVGVTGVHGSGQQLRIQGSRSVGGNLDEQMLLLRLDRQLFSRRLMAGIVVGKSNNRLQLNLSGNTGTNTRLGLVFAGLTFPLRRAEITAVLELADVDEMRRSAISLAWRRPVESGG